ncbi:(2Fe-2S) ferredoxin domain-containing protein [Sphingomonas gilva]|uniref:(2Fe-2S) ferredoxin domain-containing protein n=1 Tax=Sphingomonas gilva TaxID=2305907 RepID=A0A396RK22_9SPHN|nr:(2Fe-2S) ferredoxin domain-containing protein [Sphingomonas gilva]
MFASSNWEASVLVCRKCSKRLGGGFGPKGKMPLAKALRKVGSGKGRKARIGVVEVKCLGVCPKGAVTVIDSRDPGQWRLVRAGADLGEVAAVLGLSGAKPSGR